jgi:hypothetical protein
MSMRNILRAAALIAFGTIAVSTSANASPASALAGIGEQATASAEQVHYRGHRKGYFYGRDYWGKRHYGYWGKRHYGYGGDGYSSWRKYCYHHPYHWKCKSYGWGY